MLGGESEAEDLAQQVFLRVWQSAPRYEPGAKFTTWLLTITRNLVFNEMRRRRRSRIVAFEREGEDELLHQQADAGARSAAELAGEAELQEAISREIAALPEAQRMAVILRRYEEMPYEEIAEVLKTSVPAVKSLLFRARTELKARLGEFIR
jgi:RNA polymerase sigma-70 factor (ECF subfamily)